MQILLSLASRSISICFFFFFFSFWAAGFEHWRPEIHTTYDIYSVSRVEKNPSASSMHPTHISLIIISKEWPKFLKFLNELRTLFTYEIRYGYEKSTSSLESKIHYISKELGRGGGWCAVERTKEKKSNSFIYQKRKRKTEYLPTHLPTRPSLLSFLLY